MKYLSVFGIAILTAFFSILPVAAAEYPVTLYPSGPQAQALGSQLQYAFERTHVCRLVRQGGAKVEASSPDGKVMRGRLVSAKGKLMFQKDYQRGSAQLNCRQLADDVILALSGRPGIATSQIVFASHDGQRSRLFICDFDGKQVRSINTGFPSARGAAISPLGHRVAYLGHDGPETSRVMIKGLEGNSRAISPSREVFGKGWLSWSPDGNTLAALLSPPRNPANGKIVLFRKGKMTSEQLLSKSPVTPSSLSWSPDGKKLIYASATAPGRSGLFTIGTKTSLKPKAIQLPMPHASSPNYSPDGSSIAFVSSESNGRHLCLFFPSSGQVRKLAPGFDPHWGADSRHIAYSTGSELRTIDTKTGRSEVIVSRMGRIEEPTWTR